MTIVVFSIPKPIVFVVSAGLAVCSTYYAVRSRSAKATATVSETQAMRATRKFSTISLAFVSLDYLLKCAINPTPANLVGLFNFPIVTTRSATVWACDFQKGDSRFKRNLQKAISVITSILCVAATVGSQIFYTGSFDPWTTLNLLGILFAATADACNTPVSRRRNHLVMASFQLAFGCYTSAGTLIGKAAVDVVACLWHDPVLRPFIEVAGSVVTNITDRARRSDGKTALIVRVLRRRTM